MSAEWSRFLSTLESKGCTFEQIRLASNRRSVIESAGFTDPFAIAILETEWNSRLSNSTPQPSQRKFTPVRSKDAQPATVSPSPGKAAPEVSRLALDAYDFTRLHEAPEEVQDNVIAAELLSVAVGIGGAFINATREGFLVTSYVPATMRQLCSEVIGIAEAFVVLRRVVTAEYIGTSLVSMALGEVVSEVCTSYAHQIGKLEVWSRGRSMPLMAIAAEIQRIGYHIVRLRQVIPTETLIAREGAAALSGWRILNHLHAQSEKYAGSKEDQELLSLLLRRASVPYMRIMSRWMREGVLEDPFHEFFIVESKSTPTRTPFGEQSISSAEAASESAKRLFGGSVPLFALSAARIYSPNGNVYGADNALEEVIAFERRFTLNKGIIPSFLQAHSRVSKMIFYAGKYCCLLREYNGTLPATPMSAAMMITWTNVDDLQRMVQESYDAANAAVIQLFFSPGIDLIGHLSSLKSYFLHQRGDWLVEFLDSAEELLDKSPVQVRTHSIRVLLQTAIAKSCASDPYHDSITCSLADTTLEQYVQQSLKTDGQPARGSGRLSAMKVEARRCIELVQLEADLTWPLTLILDPLAIKHLNVVFRLLIWLKVSERNLCTSWEGRPNGPAFPPRSYSLKQQMLQFLRQFQFYAAHFVIEPQWGRMIGRITQADSVFAINNALNDFFDGVELGLVLSSSARFRSLSKILDLIARFCDLGRHSIVHLSATELNTALQSLQESFYDALAELASPGGADYPQLVPLLTWIDFSHFYARNSVFRVQYNSAARIEAGAIQSAASAGKTTRDGASVAK